MLFPEVLVLHARVRLGFLLGREAEKARRERRERVVGVFGVAFHLECLEKLRRFEHHEHVVLGQHLFARGEGGELLRDVDALHVVDRRFDGDADVGLGEAEGGIGQDVERTRETEVARIVRAERNLDTALPVDHGGVFDEVAIERDGAVGGHGAEELRLQEADVVLIEVDFREHILQHRGENVARVDDFVHTVGAFALHDGLGRAQLLTINLLRNGFVDRNGENEFARFFRGLDVLFEKGHAFDAALLEKLGRDVAQRESELIVFLIAVEITIAQVAGFFGRDDFLPDSIKHLVKGGGSLTALPVIETQAGDVSAYIPTNVISITDGQIFLESDLFNSGVRPAINVGISVSRVGGSAQIKSMKKVAGTLKLDQAQYRELEAFAKFGSDLDAATMGVIEKGKRNVEILKQPQNDPYPVENQIAIIYAGSKNLLRQVPVDKIKEFEREYLEFLNVSHRDILDELKAGKLTDEITATLEKVAKDLSEKYAK